MIRSGVDRVRCHRILDHSNEVQRPRTDESRTFYVNPTRVRRPTGLGATPTTRAFREDDARRRKVMRRSASAELSDVTPFHSRRVDAGQTAETRGRQE